MKNNKGFTVVELLTSFTLTMIIVVFLFEIILQLKEVYIETALKTKITDKNSAIATALNKKFENKSLTFASCEEGFCTLNYQDGSFETISLTQDSIDLADQIIQMPKGALINDQYMGAVAIDTDENADNAYFALNYKVKSVNLKEDISFNYVYSYKQTIPS